MGEDDLSVARVESLVAVLRRLKGIRGARLVQALAFFGTRGLLLWVVIPMTLIAWVAGLPLLLALRICRSRRVPLSPRVWIRAADQFLIAGLGRTLNMEGAKSVPWPWIERVSIPLRETVIGLW